MTVHEQVYVRIDSLLEDQILTSEMEMGGKSRELNPLLFQYFSQSIAPCMYHYWQDASAPNMVTNLNSYAIKGTVEISCPLLLMEVRKLVCHH